MNSNTNLKNINQLIDVYEDMKTVVLKKSLSKNSTDKLDSELLDQIAKANKSLSSIKNVNLDANINSNRTAGINVISIKPFTEMNNMMKNENSDLDDDLINSMLNEKNKKAGNTENENFNLENSNNERSKDIKNCEIDHSLIKNSSMLNDDAQDDDDDLLIQACQKMEKSINETPSKRIEQININDSISECKAQISYEDSCIDENFDASEYIGTLRRYFGYSSFRPMQLKIIRNTIENKRDQLVVMATGKGKSLCYQFPSIHLNKLTVVISPLISLMEDQVMSLKLVNVEACLLGSSQNEESSEVMEKILSGNVRVLYLTPEYLQSNQTILSTINDSIGICLVAIDECHCVSQWGNDFRPAYRKIGQVREMLKDVPFVGLTATATPECRKDILKSLKLINPIVTVSSFDRPNLKLSVSLKSTNIIADLKTCMIPHNKKFDGSTIIYCLRKKDCTEVSEALNAFGIKSEIYHASLSLAKRKQVQVDFMNDEIDVIVATVAFGMGIDKPDIRNVLHYGSPKDLESYYQEIGRGGRDGLPSKCKIFYSSSDYNTINFFINEINNPSYQNHKFEMFNKVKTFLTMTDCRREFILKHFQDSLESSKKDSEPNENCCDNCDLKRENSIKSPSQRDQLVDYSKEAIKLLSSIKLLGQKYGITTVGKVSEYLFSNELYGAGKNRSEGWWKSFAQQLTNQNYIHNKSGYNYGSIAELTTKSLEFLANPAAKPVKIYETPDMKQSASNVSVSISKPNTNAVIILPTVAINKINIASLYEMSNSVNSQQPEKTSEKDNELYKLLLDARNEIANQLNLTSHKVCTNKLLTDLARIKPSNLESMQKVDDFPTEKIKTIGSKFLERISTFCKKYNLEMDNISKKPSPNKSTTIVDSKINDLLMNLTPAKRETYKAFQIDKKSLDDIAFERSIQSGTVMGYLGEAFEIGLPLDFSRLNVKITDEDLNSFEKKIRQAPINSNISRLGLLKEHMPELSWDMIKLMVSILKRKYGIYDGSGGCSSPCTGKQAQLVIEKNAFDSPNQSTSQSTSSLTASTERKLPAWANKRLPSQHDLKSVDMQDNTVNKDKQKKKKLF